MDPIPHLRGCRVRVSRAQGPCAAAAKRERKRRVFLPGARIVGRTKAAKDGARGADIIGIIIARQAQKNKFF
jgi:hypothetical protein